MAQVPSKRVHGTRLTDVARGLGLLRSSCTQVLEQIAAVLTFCLAELMGASQRLTELKAQPELSRNRSVGLDDALSSGAKIHIIEVFNLFARCCHSAD